MNQVALITGASRGIGRGIALALAKRGFDLALTYLANSQAAESTEKECLAAGKSIRVRCYRSDISLREQREKLVQQVRGEFPRVDLLINNAGIAPEKRADLLEMEEASFDRLMNTNVKGPLFLTQSIAKWMIEEKRKSGREYLPKIVTISSISAYTASVNRGEYCISKAALSMMTPLFAARLAKEGVNVFEIRPGIIETDMTAGVKEKYDTLIQNDLTPIPRWGRPEDVGEAVAAIAGNHFRFSTGEVFNIDGGFHLRRL